MLLDFGWPDDQRPTAEPPTWRRLPNLALSPSCPTAAAPNPHASERAACAFAAGAEVADTLGLTADARKQLPHSHIIIVTQENRSFDHFFGAPRRRRAARRRGWPAGFTNPDANSTPVAPYHLTTNTLPVDPPHQGAAMQAGWDGGKMDGFVRSRPRRRPTTATSHGLLRRERPAVPLLAGQHVRHRRSLTSRPRSAAPGPTATISTPPPPTASSTPASAPSPSPTIFAALDAAHVTWGVYSDGTPRQDCLGWTSTHAGVHKFAAFTAALQAGTLPTVSFVDPSGCQDEHPTNDVHGGENWLRAIYEASVASPLWPSLALVITFDEAGGLADHVAPPAACPPSADQATFNRYGVRVPTIVVSAYARPHFVSHAVHDHTSILRLVEALEDLPALTARDANADALFDMFDFGCPALATPPAAPAGGSAVCM